MLVLHTPAQKSAVIMVIGKICVQMETKIGGDGVTETVDQEEVVWVQLKQD